MQISLRSGLILLFAALASAASAQEAPPAAAQAEVTFATLQTKAAFTEEDRRQLRQLIQERVDAVLAGKAASMSELRTAAASGSDRYKEEFSNGYMEIVNAAWPNAKPPAAAQLLALLNTLNRADASRTLIDALASDQVAIRTVAAVGLRDLRQRIMVAGNEFYARTIDALREAGKKESAAVALKAIYQALDFSAVGTPPDTRQIAAAALEILSARAAQYVEGEVQAEGADLEGLKLLFKLRKDLGDVEKQRLLEALGAIGRFSVLRYANELHTVSDKHGSPLQISLRNQTELTLMEAERLLGELLAPKDRKPNLTAIMQRKTEPAELKIQWNEWAQLIRNATTKDFSIGEEGP